MRRGAGHHPQFHCPSELTSRDPANPATRRTTCALAPNRLSTREATALSPGRRPWTPRRRVADDVNTEFRGGTPRLLVAGCSERRRPRVRRGDQEPTIPVRPQSHAGSQTPRRGAVKRGDARKPTADAAASTGATPLARAQPHTNDLATTAETRETAHTGRLLSRSRRSQTPRFLMATRGS